MNLPPPEQPAGLETRSFVLLMAIVTLAFGMILLPFWGSVFWGVIIAILSAPLQRLLARRMGQRRSWAALATLAILLLVVTPPLIPLRVDKYEIDLKVNQCLRCHDWPYNVQENATKISETHY